MRRPETISEIRKNITFLDVVNRSIIYKFFKDFTCHKRRLTDFSLTLPNTGTTEETFRQSEK